MIAVLDEPTSVEDGELSLVGPGGERLFRNIQRSLAGRTEALLAGQRL